MEFIAVQSAEDREAVFGLRYRVFVEEQGVPIDVERDADEQSAYHLLVRDQGKAVGTARLVVKEEIGAQISRVCVIPDYRRRGLGSILIRKLENQARRQGQTHIFLHSMVEALEFYHDLGYRAEGPIFKQAGILHRRMSKKLGDLLLVAIGGNAVADGRESMLKTAHSIVDLMQAGWRVVLSHGNGPQVGDALRRSELARQVVPPQELAECVASTQATLGYHLQQAIGSVLKERAMSSRPVTVVTQVLVDPDDPAFSRPTKPIGPFLSKEQAEERARVEGWSVMEDSGRGWRRVVPSPKPLAIFEMEAIKALVDENFLVIAAGGGGIPVTRQRQGLSAVIDKDHTASLLAHELEAEGFIISTAVPKVCLRFGQPDQINLDRMTLTEAATYIENGEFGEGSMKPKVEAARSFVEKTDRWSVITDTESLLLATRGEAGTHIVADPGEGAGPTLAL